MQRPDGRTWAAYLDFFPHLYSVAEAGWRAKKEVTESLRLGDPFAFVDQPAVGKDAGIDTTPTLPKPPAAFIESAARDIPCILANVPRDQDGTIGLDTAAHLVARL